MVEVVRVPRPLILLHPCYAQADISYPATHLLCFVRYKPTTVSCYALAFGCPVLNYGKPVPGEEG
eukprot:3488685-Rhodomonas_salina.1